MRDAFGNRNKPWNPLGNTGIRWAIRVGCSTGRTKPLLLESRGLAPPEPAESRLRPRLAALQNSYLGASSAAQFSTTLIRAAGTSPAGSTDRKRWPSPKAA